MVYELWVNPTSLLPDHLKWDLDKARNWITGYIDKEGFDVQVVLVAALGFLTDSYALFATNVILPSLAYLYWPDANNGRNQLTINCVTLAGSVCGQILFGYLADRYGRRKLYGIELVIVIFGTLGMAQVSTGKNNSMSIMGWIAFWRFFMGLGIGAEYPLSAVITAEFASKKYRATMMAVVFAMQPVGQFCAATVGWAVLTSLAKARGLDNLPIHGAELTDQQKLDILSTIDSVWRCVVGAGAFPAILAILFRLSIPESPRYTLDVLKDGLGAFWDIRVHNGEKTTDADAKTQIGRTQTEEPWERAAPSSNIPTPEEALRSRLPEIGESSTLGQVAPVEDQPVTGGEEETENTSSRNKAPNYFNKGQFGEYLMEDMNWTWLAATAGCWFLLDFAFYGLAIDNPRRIAAIWAPSSPNNTEFQSDQQAWPSSFGIGNATTVYSNASIPDWENPFDIGTNIYKELYGNCYRYVITITLGSLAGSLVMACTIHMIRRRGWLVLSFLILALLFIIMGSAMQTWMFHPSHPWAIAFYIICQFFFNFGPNTLTFIIPAEIFPTRYRCFCHGLSAAAGKVGSLAVQSLLARHEFTTDPTHFRIVLGCFSIPMVLGAILAWVWLPDLQDPPLASKRTCIPPTSQSKSLETLAKGRKLAVDEGQILTFKGKFDQVRRRFLLSGGHDPRATVEHEARSHELPKYPQTTIEGVNGDRQVRSLENGGSSGHEPSPHQAPTDWV